MATASKTDIKDRIANNKLLKQILIDMVDSYLDSIDGPLDFETEAILQIDGTTELGVKNDGRLYGRSLHDQGDVTGTTDQYIASGTYTPTLTNGANVTASTPFKSQWLRVGNVVTVSGVFTLQPTAVPLKTQLAISLPIPSNISGFFDCCGNVALAEDYSQNPFAIKGDEINNRALVEGYAIALTTLSDGYYYSFTYEIK